MRFSLPAILLLFLVTSCDFNAASNAVEEFEVLIGLPPLASVVNVQALDASSGSPLTGTEVSVAFEGEDAGSVVDIYSDPISELMVQDGFGNFALDSTTISPSPGNPAVLTLRATADGYETTTTSVRITETGSVVQSLSLTPDNPERSPSGAAGEREVVGTGEGNPGEVNNPVTMETGKTSSGTNGAQGSATIPAGTRLQTADGTPLQGQVTSDLSVYDNSVEAQELLPKEAKVNADGQHRQIQGAVRFEMRDENGRVANQYGTDGSDTTTVTTELPTLDTRNGPPSLTLVDAETGDTRTVGLSSSSGASKAATSRSPGQTTLRFVDNQVIIQSPFGTATVDAGEFSGPFLGAVGTQSTDSNTCTPADLNVDTNGQQGSMRVQISGNGLAVAKTVSIPSGQSSFTLSASALFEGDIPALNEATLEVLTPDDQRKTTTIDPCAESVPVTLPAPATNRIDATVRLEANCPEGERLPVSPPFDGYSVAYRRVGSSGPYWTIPKENITINTTDDAKETVTSAVVSITGVLPDTDYEVVGTFGGRSSIQTVTTPTAAEAESVITVTEEELTAECR